VIILEGPDGAGKTTLAHLIGDRFDLKVLHSPGPGNLLHLWLLEATIQERADRRSDILPALRPQVYDRFFFSELVYGPILRKRSCYPPEFHGLFFNYILPSARPLVIFCLPPLHEIIIAAKHNEQMDGVMEHLDEIWQAYNVRIPIWMAGLRSYGNNSLVYHWTNLGEVLKAVSLKLEGRH
jgi:hypothetical protein